MMLHEDLRATRDEIQRYIEQELGWDVTELRAEQDEGYDEEDPTELCVRVEFCTEIENGSENDYKL